MSSGREDIQAGIRRALGRGPIDEVRRHALLQRMASPEPHLKPQVPGDVVERFVAKATAAAMTLTRVAELADAPAAVFNYIREKGLAKQLLVAGSLRGLPWSNELSLSTAAARKEDLLSVTPCFAAIAETGSVVLLSSPESPTTLNFVPDDHIVILRTDQIVRHIEDVWPKLRARGGPVPRTVNVISGPSRTADVEQTVQLGVHGPRRLHVVLVGR